MDDDFDEILDELEEIDCSVLEEIGREEGKPVKQDYLGTLIIFITILSAMTFGITKLLTI